MCLQENLSVQFTVSASSHHGNLINICPNSVLFSLVLSFRLKDASIIFTKLLLDKKRHPHASARTRKKKKKKKEDSSARHATCKHMHVVEEADKNLSGPPCYAWHEYRWRRDRCVCGRVRARRKRVVVCVLGASGPSPPPALFLWPF